jgi:hypothetical protein
MRAYSICSCLLAALLFVPLPALAASAEASVKITSPADGAKLDAMEQAKLVYEFAPGPRGDHVHIYVDNKEVDILRKLAGSYTLETLAAGAHTICVKVVNKAHVPIGVEKCIKVSVE